MSQIALDFTAGRTVARMLFEASAALLTVDGRGGASGCGSPAVAAAVAEFETELMGYLEDFAQAIAGVGAAALDAISDVENLERAHVALIDALARG